MYTSGDKVGKDLTVYIRKEYNSTNITLTDNKFVGQFIMVLGRGWVFNNTKVRLRIEAQDAEPVTAVPTKLTVESENLFQIKPITRDQRGITMVWDGEFLTLNGTAESEGTVQYYQDKSVRIQLPAGVLLRVTAEYVSGEFSNNTALWIGFAGQEDAMDKRSISVTAKAEYTANSMALPEEASFLSNFFARVYVGYTYNNAKWRIRIEEHEPQTVTIPAKVDDLDMPFLAVGGVGDCIEVDTLLNKVTYIQKVRSLEFDGTENWSLINGKFVILNNKPAASTSIRGWCNKYNWNTYADVDNSFGCNGGNISVKDTTYNEDVESFKAWLANTKDNRSPMKAMYALNTPIETDITNTEFGQQLLALQAYDKYTRVRVDSNVSMPINVNYWKQIKP
jgi:hypothetical protein